MDIPERLTKEISDACLRIGVMTPPWHITVKMSDRPGGMDDAAGFASVDPVYMNADLEFWDGLTEEQYRPHVMHEVLHIAHRQVTHAVDRILGRLPDEEVELHRALYREAVENFTQQLARALTKENDES